MSGAPSEAARAASRLSTASCRLASQANVCAPVSFTSASRSPMLRAASATLTPSLDSARASEAERPAPAPTISAGLNLALLMKLPIHCGRACLRAPRCEAMNVSRVGRIAMRALSERTMLRSVQASALPRQPRLAGPRRRHRHAVPGILVELVAQRADRDAENVGGAGAVAEAVLERLENEIALDVGDGAADQRARHRLGGERRMRDRQRVPGLIEPHAVGREDAVAAALVAGTHLPPGRV